MKSTRVTAVLTHPVQYYAPWFRWIHANTPDIDLHVVYASAPTPAQQGAGFGQAFAWDVPLTEGYQSTIVRPARENDRFDAGHYFGLNVPEIDQAIADSRPDVVVVFGWYSVTLIRAIRAARRLKVPVLYHGDTNLQSAPGGWRWLPWLVKTRWLLSQFDGYLSVGVRSAGFLRYFGIPGDRIFHTPHCVDNERFAEAVSWRRSAGRREEIRRALGLPIDAFVVLFAGKLEPKKRPMDLVHALGAMTPRPHLAMAGTGLLESAIGEAAARLGVGCTMLGFVNQSQMARVYAAADCLALPSDERETWGLVVNEALAAGLPCVMSDRVGCAPDLGSGATGGVYAMAEPELIRNFAAALSDVRDRLGAGHDFTAPCRQRAAAHDFAHAAAGLERACAAVTMPPHPKAAQAPEAASPRVLACCGGMVRLGGLERMTFEVLSVLRQRGAAVHCVVNDWDNYRLVEKAEEIGASWSPRRPVTITRTLNPIKVAAILWGVLRASAGLLQDARRFRATHVLLPDYLSALNSALAIALLRAMGVKSVMRVGNAPDPGRFYRFVWRAIVGPLTGRFVPNSSFTERALLAHGLPGRKVTRIYNPVGARSRAAEEAPASHEAGRLIFVGQMIPGKGVDVLLEAVARLVSSGYGHVRLDLVGDLDAWGPAYTGYREQLRARAQQSDLATRVRLLGWREDVPSLLATASIHCCPSMPALRESFANVVLEAKAAGIPSVVFPTGSLTELVDHRVDGWVCDACTAVSLAAGLAFFLDDEPRREAAGRQARRSLERFGWDQFATAWWSVFVAQPAAAEVTPMTHPGASSA